MTGFGYRLYPYYALRPAWEDALVALVDFNINKLKSNGVCNPVTHVFSVIKAFKRFSRGSKPRSKWVGNF